MKVRHHADRPERVVRLAEIEVRVLGIDLHDVVADRVRHVEVLVAALGVIELEVAHRRLLESERGARGNGERAGSGAAGAATSRRAATAAIIASTSSSASAARASSRRRPAGRGVDKGSA